MAARDLFIAGCHEFDLVVTDQVMPRLIGEEPAETVMKTRPDMPVILCSGYNTSMDEKAAKSKGIRAFAQKPLMRKEPARLLQEVLDEAPHAHRVEPNV